MSLYVVLELKGQMDQIEAKINKEFKKVILLSLVVLIRRPFLFMSLFLGVKLFMFIVI